MAHKSDREKREGRENARSHSQVSKFFCFVFLVCFFFVFRLSDGLFVSLFRGWGLVGGRGGAVKFNGVESVKAECVRVGGGGGGGWQLNSTVLKAECVRVTGGRGRVCVCVGGGGGGGSEIQRC